MFLFFLALLLSSLTSMSSRSSMLMSFGVAWLESLGEVTFDNNHIMLLYPTSSGRYTIAGMTPSPRQLFLSNMRGIGSN